MWIHQILANAIFKFKPCSDLCIWLKSRNQGWKMVKWYFNREMVVFKLWPIQHVSNLSLKLFLIQFNLYRKADFAETKKSYRHFWRLWKKPQENKLWNCVEVMLFICTDLYIVYEQTWSDPIRNYFSAEDKVVWPLFIAQYLLMPSTYCQKLSSSGWCNKQKIPWTPKPTFTAQESQGKFFWS